MINKITARLQTPVDESGNRTDIHLITTAEEVIMNPEADEPKTLAEVMDTLGTVQISSSQPEFPCIWAQPKTLN